MTPADESEPRIDPRREDDLEIAPASAADRDEQSALHASCFKKPLAPGGLAWRYDDVPHGPSISLVARPPGLRAVSGYACNPRLAVSFGRPETLAVVGETGDVMTHPDWRKRGAFSRLDRAATDEARRRGWALAFGLPNRRSAHIFVELGWRTIGSVRTWTFVLRNDERARERRRKEGWLRALGTGRAHSRGRLRRAAMRDELSRYRVVELREFPPEVERLSAAVEKGFAFMLRRDKRYLDWRFLRAPSRLHSALGIVDAGDALAGYAVVQRPRPGEAAGHLVDLLALDARGVRACIELALGALEEAGASVVEASAIDGSWWSARLAESGFVPPREESRLSVILHPLAEGHPLVAAAARASDWYFTDGDRDDETVG